MAPVIHEIVPEPDTVVILRNACSDFAPWPPARKGSSVKTKNAKSSAQQASEHGPAASQSASKEAEEEEIHYHVSSRHLITASAWFKRALTKETWRESDRNEKDGRFHIIAEDWDAEALLIVFRIIHLCNRKVSRTLNLEMLAKIGVIIDYYEMDEAIEVFADIWTKVLDNQKVPDEYCRDLVLWIWVSWAFGMKGRLWKATNKAMNVSIEPIRSLELPIPAKFLESMSETRDKHIEAGIRCLYDLMEKYRSPVYNCPADHSLSFQCGSFLLGALTKELYRLGLATPRPEAPFEGLSVDTLYEKLKSIRSATWFDDHCEYSHSCTLPISTILSQRSNTGFSSTKKEGRGTETTWTATLR